MIAADDWRVTEVLEIDRTFAALLVRFCLITRGDHQFVAYYDINRQMTVAQRALGQTRWTYRRLDEFVRWDNHNYVTMAVDRDGFLHVSGNMHTAPLVYFRSSQPLDVTSLERVDIMVEPGRERSVTYPIFLHAPGGELIFKYRDGRSGAGDEIYNVLDPLSGEWQRLLDTPLLKGEGRCNAYPMGPVLGPDGFFHLVWVWRDTPDASTNHDLSYARSRDLRDWERSDGSALTLPMTSRDAEVIDPVPVRGGMINNNTLIGFDARGRVIVSYHKFDAHGNTQLYCARREESGWIIRQVSDWEGYRWEFGGHGALDGQVSISAVVPAGDNLLALDYVRCGERERLILDEATLQRLKVVPQPQIAGLSMTPPSGFPDMRVNIAVDQGTPVDDKTKYLLRWETLPPNRDHPRRPPWPEPSPLELYKLVRPS